MPERPLLIPLASLIAGLCTADLLGAAPPSWALPALLATTFIACFAKSTYPFLLSVCMLFFVWGEVSLEPFLRPSEPVPAVSDTPVLIQGVLLQRPEGTSSGGSRIVLQVEHLRSEQGARPAGGRLLVQVKEGRARLLTGDRVLFSSKIRRPRTLGLPGESDYPRRLAYQGIFSTGFVKSAEELVPVREGDGWRHGIDKLACSLGRFISNSCPGVEGGVLKALLLGDRGDIPEELDDAYARSGVNHILSISGFHVGIIFLCVFQLLFLLARRSELLALHLNLRRTLLVASLPVVVFYLFLSGAAPATVRSVLMIAAFIGSLHLRREMDPVNSVMLAASLILFSAPETLFEVSFQLSFLAIWGLVVLTPPLAGWLEKSNRTLRWVLLMVTASVAAILATLVPVAYYFHRISWIGLVANLVIVPLMGYGAVVLGFLSLPLSLLAAHPAAMLIRLAGWLVGLSDQIIMQLGRAPVFTGYAPERIDLLLACLALCSLTFLRSKHLRVGATAALVLALVIRGVPAAQGGDGEIHAYFLSVGQGDATLLRLPDGKWMLVDGGGRAGDTDDRVGERLLMPPLSRLGVRRLDYLVLTHEHPDHLQGVLYLARSFEVGELWESGGASPGSEYQQLQWVAAARGIPVRTVNGAGTPFAAGGALVEPLWPRSEEPAAEDRNESSLVFRVGIGKGSLLFTGDAGAEAEKELMERGVRLQSTLLKVGHHGSRYASTEPFLAAVHPAIAVISVGYANPFRLPAPATVQRLERQGIRVYRTDLDGTVEAVCRGDGTIAVSTPWGHFN